jgi:outer membrane protein assembly factor BamA
MLRQDKSIQKATDQLSLAYDVLSHPDAYSSLSRLEYVFDNTISPAMNILRGTRYKMYAEYIYGLNNGNRSCYNIGLDIRNYQKIYKNFILANRLAYGHSDGNSEVEYLLGGVDNWIGPKRDPASGQQAGGNFGFQALETSLRGYKQYARTGNNFAVFSTEFRLPVITTFIKRPIQSALLKNLQVVAFADAGTAWKGFVPNSDNLSNTYYYPTTQAILNGQYTNSFMSVTVPFSNSLAVGFGPGLRTSLLGYFVRFDAAWNIEGSKKPIFYVALGTDF